MNGEIGHYGGIDMVEAAALLAFPDLLPAWTAAMRKQREASEQALEALSQFMFILAPPPELEQGCTNEALNEWLFWERP